MAFLLAAAGGCRKSATESSASGKDEPSRAVTVEVVQRKTIHRDVGQPGVIQAFERTPIVAKIPGYVSKRNFDLGDHVEKGRVLAELWVPEMIAELKYKEEQVEQAKKTLAMAEAQVATAKAQVQESEAAHGRAEASHNYWKGQNARLTSLVKENVLDKQTQEETLNQYRAAAASLAEAQARIESSRSIQIEKEKAKDKAEVDIRAAEADRLRQAEMVGYATLLAPYDGVVVERNISLWQFVQPATATHSDVLFVVEQTDVVRVFVSVPETDADWVLVGAPATVRVQALMGEEFAGTVTRTSWSLNRTTRTLLAEIDLKNPRDKTHPEGRLRPGMYAYATIDAEWKDVPTIPASALVTEGDVNVGYRTYCFLYDGDGHVKRTPIRIGARNDKLVEVLQKQIPAEKRDEAPRWTSFTGAEKIVQGDLAGLKDGQEVTVKSMP
jgi:multidrug efflux pump subunit AcrA (membrane-fusion protein)